MRVLLLAYDCNPEWPSLPIVGYNTCRTIADHADVTLATHVRNRKNIEKIGGLGRGRVVYIDNEYIAGPMYRMSSKMRGGTSLGWTTNIAMSYVPYLAFEREVLKRFKPEIKAGQFDLVHRVTPMSPTLPSPIAKWAKPLPFVIGPLNGGLKWPAAFSGERKREKEWLTYVRGAYRLLPYYRSTYKRSAAILAAFTHTIDDLPSGCRDRVLDFPEVGIDPSRFAAPQRTPKKPGDQLTFLYAGRLVPYKCPDVALRAFASRSELANHRMIIVGDGPERPKLEQIVRDEKLEGRVTLTGKKPQAEVAQHMREADVFVFPSIRELGAGVVVEAMACGMTCVVVDYGGPSALIRDGNGVKVPLASKDELVRAIGEQLVKLAADPGQCVTMGEKARNDALGIYGWDVKARKTVQAYEWALGRGPKPDFYRVQPPANLDPAAGVSSEPAMS